MTKTFVSRINQIDAVQLNNEIYKVLRAQTEEITNNFTPGKVTKWQPEVDLFVKFLIWSYSLKNTNATFGQQLLNLSYSDLNKKKAILLFLFATMPDYLQLRLMSENFRISRNFSSNLDRLDNFIRLLNFLWTFYFLYSGNQPLMVEKLLNVYNCSSNNRRPRGIGYSYMTRELLWHGLIELFTISIPMIDFRQFQRYWNQFWLPKKTEQPKVVALKLDVNSKCSYCEQRPILPKWAGCPHVFCYYCLEAHFVAMDRFKCPVCKTELYSSDIKSYLNY